MFLDFEDTIDLNVWFSASFKQLSCDRSRNSSKEIWLKHQILQRRLKERDFRTSPVTESSLDAEPRLPGSLVEAMVV